MRSLRISFLGLLLSASAFAQQAVQTIPSPRSSYNASGTIASTGVFQNVWPEASMGQPSTQRTGCVVQNKGTNTMYVFFGPIASATTGASVALPAGGNVSCSTSTGVVLRDEVNVTGTAGDAFFAAQQ